MSRFTKGLMAVAGMSLCVSTAAVANDLTVVSWGGAYTKSQVEAYHKPWMAETGKTIISEDYGGGIAEIKAQVESGNVTWDVVDVELSDAIRACDEGLLETIDHSILPAAPDGTPAALLQSPLAMESQDTLSMGGRARTRYGACGRRRVTPGFPFPARDGRGIGAGQEESPAASTQR